MSKKNYQAPQLKKLGSAAELTHTNWGGSWKPKYTPPKWDKDDCLS